jgi:hypothetical protein
LTVALCGTACIYLPAFHHTAGAKRILAIRPGVDTRGTVLRKLGDPNVLYTDRFYVHEWDRHRGYLIGFMAGDEIIGKRFRVLVRFENGVVTSVEMDPDLSKPSPDSTGKAPPSEVDPCTPLEPDTILRARDVLKKRPLTDVAKSGNLVAAVDRDANLWLWQDGAERGSRIQMLPIGEKRHRARVAVTADGRTVALAGTHAAAVWDVERREVVAQKRHQTGTGGVYAPIVLGISPDGRRLFFGRRKGFVALESPDWQVAWSLGTTDPIRYAAFSVDGTRIFAVRADRAGMDVLDASNGQRLGRLGKRVAHHCSKWDSYTVHDNPAGRLLLRGDVVFETWDLAGIETVGPDGIPLLRGRETAPLLDVRLMSQFLPLKGCGKTGSGIQDSDFSGDGRLLLVHKYREVRVYETEHFSEVRRFFLPKGVQRVRFAGGGRQILAVLDGEVHIWNLS